MPWTLLELSHLNLMATHELETTILILQMRKLFKIKLLVSSGIGIPLMVGDYVL